MLRQVVHADGQAGEQDEVEIYKHAPGQTLSRDRDGVVSLDLSSLKLAKGDQLKVTVQAVDYRGPRPGQASLSEPLVFHVTDLQGILQMVTESDRKSAEQLQIMIQRQLGIGGGK